jgi:fructokinase
MSVICFGELIIDFTSMESGRPLWSVEKFQKNIGGAPANVAIGLSHHGVPVSLWSRVGNDSFGSYLIQKLEDLGLATSGISRDNKFPTKLAFVGIDKGGERHFEFHNLKSAEQNISLKYLPIHELKSTKVFHFGGVTLLGKRTAETTMKVLEIAKGNKCIISFDPNIRLDLIRNPQQVLERLIKVLPYVDILKLSYDDWQQFFAAKKPSDIIGKNMTLLIITEGAKGARILTHQKEISVRADKVKATDTTGAGDAFMAAFLSKILKFPSSIFASEISAQLLKDWVDFSSHWAGRIVRSHGAVSGYFQ